MMNPPPLWQHQIPLGAQHSAIEFIAVLRQIPFFQLLPTYENVGCRPNRNAFVRAHFLTMLFNFYWH
jgi:hypothetical protein